MFGSPEDPEKAVSEIYFRSVDRKCISETASGGDGGAVGVVNGSPVYHPKTACLAGFDFYSAYPV